MVTHPEQSDKEEDFSLELVYHAATSLFGEVGSDFGQSGIFLLLHLG